MGEVGIRALKQNASDVVRRAAKGEVIIITDRGRPVAQMTAIQTSRLDQLIAAGLATPPKRDLRDLPYPPDGPPLSEEVIRSRDEERY